MGEIIATPERGSLMGNRGCLHDDAHRIVRTFQRKAWIYCALSFKDRRRTVMSPGQYTELFFFDEATALAAGHRPCAKCLRARYDKFIRAWRAANCGTDSLTSGDLDQYLHGDRMTGAGKKRLHSADLAALPNGTFIRWPTDNSNGLSVIAGRAIFAWSPKGYAAPVPRPAHLNVDVVTPASIVRALAAGYPLGMDLEIERLDDD